MPLFEETSAWADVLAHKDELSLQELAHRAGVTPGVLADAMRRTRTAKRPVGVNVDQAIPPDDVAGRRAVADRPRRGYKDARIEPYRELLGRVADPVIARRAGVSVGTVLSFRKRHGIPAYVRGEDAMSAITPVAPTALAAMADGALVWQVDVRENGSAARRFLLAADLRDAVDRALATGREVLGVSLVGRML